MSSVSIVIPTFNEEKNPYFRNILDSLSCYKYEVIISDGGSEDRTLALAKNYNVKVLVNKTPSRAERINLGIEASSRKMILLHHPRSLVSPEGLDFLCSEKFQTLSWGGFSHQFDKNHPMLKFTSWYSNKIRGAYNGIVYLDHCIFLSRYLADKIGPLPKVEIFEDTILSNKLRRLGGSPHILPFKATTSAIRFQQNGIYKHSLINQILKIKYYLGSDHKEMNKFYEKEKPLNRTYEK